MTTRLLSLLLVLVLSWAGFATQAQAGAVVAASSEAATATAIVVPDAMLAEGLDDGPIPADGGIPAPGELLIDLPVVFHHGADAPLPSATMAPPGAPADAAWRSACLDGLQRPPCAALLTA